MANWSDSVWISLHVFAISIVSISIAGCLAILYRPALYFCRSLIHNILHRSNGHQQNRKQKPLWKCYPIALRFPIYISLMNLCWYVPHFFDLLFSLINGHLLYGNDCLAIASLMQLFSSAQLLFVVCMAVVVYLKICRQYDISLGKYDWKLGAAVGVGSGVYTSISIGVGALGPCEFWCHINENASSYVQYLIMSFPLGLAVIVVTSMHYRVTRTLYLHEAETNRIFAKTKTSGYIGSAGTTNSSLGATSSKTTPSFQTKKHHGITNRVASRLMVYALVFLYQFLPYVIAASLISVTGKTSELYFVSVFFANSGGFVNAVAYWKLNKKKGSSNKTLEEIDAKGSPKFTKPNKRAPSITIEMRANSNDKMEINAKQDTLLEFPAHSFLVRLPPIQQNAAFGTPETSLQFNFKTPQISIIMNSPRLLVDPPFSPMSAEATSGFFQNNISRDIPKSGVPLDCQNNHINPNLSVVSSPRHPATHRNECDHDEEAQLPGYFNVISSVLTAGQSSRIIQTKKDYTDIP